MKNILSTFVILFTISITAQTQNCSELKGIWYYILMRGASEPVYLGINGCEWKEYGNPFGNRKGTVIYSTKKKKFEIVGLADADAGHVYLTKFNGAKGIYYLAWTSSFSNERTYIILTRQKYRGKEYDEAENILRANNK